MVKQVFYGSGKWVSSTPEDVWLETQRGYGLFKHDARKRLDRAQLKKQIKSLRQEGASLKEIAKTLGIRIQSVRYYEHHSLPGHQI